MILAVGKFLKLMDLLFFDTSFTVIALLDQVKQETFEFLSLSSKRPKLWGDGGN